MEIRLEYDILSNVVHVWLMRSPCYLCCVPHIQLLDWLSWNFIWALCHWRPTQLHTFNIFYSQ